MAQVDHAMTRDSATDDDDDDDNLPSLEDLMADVA
jgi:hypothetical protein